MRNTLKGVLERITLPHGMQSVQQETIQYQNMLESNVTINEAFDNVVYVSSLRITYASLSDDSIH